jgi:hypothetical protein
LDKELAEFEANGLPGLNSNEIKGYFAEKELYTVLKEVAEKEGWKFDAPGLKWYLGRKKHSYDIKLNGWRIDSKSKLGFYYLSQYLPQAGSHSYDAIIEFSSTEELIKADKSYVLKEGMQFFAITFSDWFNKPEKVKAQLIKWIRENFGQKRFWKIWTDQIKVRLGFNKADNGKSTKNGNCSEFNKVSTDQNSTNSKTESMEYYCNTMSGKDKDDQGEINEGYYIFRDGVDECKCKIEFNKTKHCIICSPRCKQAWLLSSYCREHKPITKLY